MLVFSRGILLTHRFPRGSLEAYRMAETIKKGDFIELDYTGKIKGEDIVFDTTEQSVADEHELEVHKEFKPVIICVGEQHVLPGVDKALEGQALGKHSFDVAPEDAFGKKDAKLLQLIPRRAEGGL